MRTFALPRSKRVISAAIFVVALLVRVLPMGLYVTPDEPIWVLRSLHFYDALRSGDFSAIPQTGHPGMTTMALGALSITVNAVLAPAQMAVHANWLRNIAWLAPENSAAFPHLYFFLPLARFFVAVTTSLCVAWLHQILYRRLGKRAAWLAALFIALSPFLTGLSGLLHTDALQASFAMLAVTLVLPQRDQVHSHSWLTITLAGLCLALTGMSKTLGWLVAPGAALVLLFSYRGSWWQRIGVTGTLTLATLGFAVLLYPPLWVQPVEAFKVLTGAVGYHEDLGLRNVFFMGKMQANPGLWFYPAVLLFRLTPPVSLGLIFGVARIIEGIRGRLFRKPSHSPLPRGDQMWGEGGQANWLLIPVSIYLLGITVATKKFDRYAASVFPMLAIIAATQWQSILGQRLYIKRVLLACLLLPIALTLVLPLYFADPLVGGPWLAQHVIPLGWGEGEGVAANKLNTSYIGGMVLLTDNVPGAASFYRGSVFAWDDNLLPCVAVYLNGESHTSETFALHIAGIPFVYVTPTTNIPAPLPESSIDAELCAFVLSGTTHSGRIATFDSNLDLLDYHVSMTNQAPDALTLKLRWSPESALTVRDVYLVLYSSEEDLIWDEGGGLLIGLNGWPAAKWIPGEVFDAEAYIPLDLTMPPGTYRLGLRLIGQDHNWLSVTTPAGGFAGVELDLGEVEIVRPRYLAAELDLPVLLSVPFAGGTIAGYSELPAQRYAGEMVPFQLAIRRDSDIMPESLTWEVHCDDGTRLDGDITLQRDLELWPVGYTYILRYAVPLPVDMPDAFCRVAVHANSGLLAELGTFTALARERSFAFAKQPRQALAIQVGDFAQLVGADSPETLTVPLAVTLYWSAIGFTDIDYTVFVQLLDANGQVVAQIDARPAQGTAPTSTWLEGQAILDAYTLDLPDDLPPGMYSLIAGLYDPLNGTRVPLYDKNGRLDGDYMLLRSYEVTE